MHDPKALRGQHALLLAAFTSLSVAVDLYLLLGVELSEPALTALVAKYPVTLAAVAVAARLAGLLHRAAEDCARDLHD